MMPDRLTADATGIARAAELLRNGALVAFPTDTVYGIGCRAGDPATFAADEVAIAFAASDQPAATIDGGPVPGGVASSVLDMTGERPRLLREGALSRSQLEAVIGPID